MGKHFDTLVDTVKRMPDGVKVKEVPLSWVSGMVSRRPGDEFDSELLKLTDVEKFNLIRACNRGIKGIGDLRQYLAGLIRSAALFELPATSHDMRFVKMDETEDFMQYIIDYSEMSRGYGVRFASPFRVTAIEDEESVVIMDYLGGDEYVCVGASDGSFVREGFNVNFLSIGYVNAMMIYEDGFLFPSFPLFNVRGIGKHLELDHLRDNTFLSSIVGEDVKNDAIAYIKELIYIMDPDNFIIREDRPNSRRRGSKKIRKSGMRDLRKTSMRPHYLCCSETDAAKMFKGESKEKRAAHPVRGHWRLLQSEKYKNKQGQRIYVKQYWTGDGKVKTLDGKEYEVYIKESPASVTAYSRVGKEAQ